MAILSPISHRGEIGPSGASPPGALVSTKEIGEEQSLSFYHQKRVCCKTIILQQTLFTDLGCTISPWVVLASAATNHHGGGQSAHSGGQNSHIQHQLSGVASLGGLVFHLTKECSGYSRQIRQNTGGIDQVPRGASMGAPAPVGAIKSLEKRKKRTSFRMSFVVETTELESVTSCV